MSSEITQVVTAEVKIDQPAVAAPPRDEDPFLQFAKLHPLERKMTHDESVDDDDEDFLKGPNTQAPFALKAGSVDPIEDFLMEPNTQAPCAPKAEPVRPKSTVFDRKQSKYQAEYQRPRKRKAESDLVELEYRTRLEKMDPGDLVHFTMWCSSALAEIIKSGDVEEIYEDVIRFERRNELRDSLMAQAGDMPYYRKLRPSDDPCPRSDDEGKRRPDDFEGDFRKS